MSKPQSIGELRDNLDIKDFDEWADSVLVLATKLRDATGQEVTDFFQFENAIYQVIVKKVDEAPE